MIFKETDLIPVFQPIMSIENNHVYGYEVYKCNKTGGNYQVLSYYFNNDDVDIIEKREVDRIIREKAIKLFKNETYSDEKIFLKLKLEWIDEYTKNPEKMPTLKWFRKYELDPQRLVVEISEENLCKCTDSSLMGLSYYRSLGIKLAIDDYGKNGLAVDLLANIRPDMIKISGDLIKKSESSDVFKEYLINQTTLASKLGIEVVYKGIENKKQLENCVKSSGRYYQGDIIGKPMENIKDIKENEQLKNCFIKYVMSLQNKQAKKTRLRHKLDKVVDKLIEEKVFCKDGEETDARLLETADLIPSYVKRIYLCNKYGFQITSNVEYLEGKINLIDNYDKNWAWRDYFKEAIFSINSTTKSYITHAYKNISNNESIYTYVCQLDGITYLLADVSVDSL